MEKTRVDGPAALWFATFTRGAHRALPRPLRRILPTTFIGYALINGSAFGIDMALLSLMHGVAHIGYPVAVTIGYVLASSYAFIMNRWLNFREHGDLGVQSTKYTVVMVSNYLIWILAFSSLLEWIGVQYQIARVVAACIEGLYIYLMLRLWVFPRHDRTAAPDTAVAPPRVTA